MAQTVPNTEPASFVSGDTVAWTKSLPNYPASAGWSLKYRLINAAGKIDIVASAAGDDYAITVSAATTAAYVAGQYTWQSYVEKAGERYTLETGRTFIKPNLSAQAGGFDIRTSARKTLDLLNAAMVEHGANAWTQEYEIAGRRMKYRSPAEFDAWRNRLKAEVAREEAAERIAAGMGGGTKLYVRF